MKKSIAILSAWLMILGDIAANPAGPPDPRQGGEEIATAFVLSGPLPIISTGTSEGYSNDYDEVCPYEGSTAPDVVYSYTPASNVTVDIDLCGSSFDTKLYIYENSYTPGIPFDCDDDFYLDDSCGFYVSKIEGAVLTGGNTYYIIIDGYDEFAFGDYILKISDASPPPPCTWGEDILCPESATAESETCGGNTNGGCTMSPGTENWESVFPVGETFCGTLWAEGGDRDTDQYELVLTETSLVILTADATQLIQYGLLSGGTGGYGSNPDCLTITGISPSNTAGPCDETVLDLGLLSPGTYWFSVSLTAETGFPCDNQYWLDFDVIPETCPPPVDLAATNITATSALLSWTESGLAAAWEYQLGLSGFVPDPSGTSTISNPNPVSGLTHNTSYDFYVRASCDTLFSEWEGPVSFTTLCDTIINFPWTEGFESAWSPDCWTDNELADYGWSQSTYGSAKSGSEWAYCNLAGSMLSTPAITLSSNAVLSFWYRVEEEYFPQALTVNIGDNVIYQFTAATNENYKKANIPLTDYTGQVVSITFTGGTGAGGLDFGICIDQVSIKQLNTWIGNTTDWNNSGNWSLGFVPGQSDAAYIPSVPSGSNFPLIFGSISAICDHITVANGATINVQPGNTLTIKNQ
jgi:hypothetical protein